MNTTYSNSDENNTNISPIPQPQPQPQPQPHTNTTYTNSNKNNTNISPIPQPQPQQHIRNRRNWATAAFASISEHILYGDSIAKKEFNNHKTAAHIISIEFYIEQAKKAHEQAQLIVRKEKIKQKQLWKSQGIKSLQNYQTRCKKEKEQFQNEQNKNIEKSVKLNKKDNYFHEYVVSKKAERIFKYSIDPNLAAKECLVRVLNSPENPFDDINTNALNMALNNLNYLIYIQHNDNDCITLSVNNILLPSIKSLIRTSQLTLENWKNVEEVLIELFYLFDYSENLMKETSIYYEVLNILQTKKVAVYPEGHFNTWDKKEWDMLIDYYHRGDHNFEIPEIETVVEGLINGVGMVGNTIKSGLLNACCSTTTIDTSQEIQIY
eukprot:Pgem_evm1s13822